MSVDGGGDAVVKLDREFGSCGQECKAFCIAGCEGGYFLLGTDVVGFDVGGENWVAHLDVQLALISDCIDSHHFRFFSRFHTVDIITQQVNLLASGNSAWLDISWGLLESDGLEVSIDCLC